MRRNYLFSFILVILTTFFLSVTTPGFAQEEEEKSQLGFAHYLFDAYENRSRPANMDSAQQLIQEAGLFIEAAHACHIRMMENGA